VEAGHFQIRNLLNNLDNMAKEEFFNTNSEVLSENIGDNQKLAKDGDPKDITNDKTNEQLVVEQEKYNIWCKNTHKRIKQKSGISK